MRANAKLVVCALVASLGACAGDLDPESFETTLCTTGGAMKAATPDGRPILWQNLDLSKDKSVLLRKVVGAGTQNDALQILRASGFVSNAVNSKGLAYVVNTLADLGGYADVQPFRRKLEKNFSTIGEVRNYLKARGTQDFGSNHMVMDASGSIVNFEVGSNDFWEYDPMNPARQQQASFQSPKLFVTRANTPFMNNDHQEPDAEVDSWTYVNSGVRYRKARDLFIQNITDSDKLTIAEMLTTSRWGDPGHGTRSISSNATIWGNVVLGVKPGEDPRYTTMLVAMGYPDYSIYVPAWAALSQSELCSRVKTWDANNIGWWAFKLYDDKFDNTADYDNYIRSVFGGVEGNIIDAVKMARDNWLVSGNTSRFQIEARDLHNLAGWAAYETIKSAYDTAGSNGRSCNLPPEISKIDVTKNGLKVTLTCQATDPDGDGIAAYSWRFGDGDKQTALTSATVTHTYAQSGTYLVGCFVRDGRASRAANLKFRKITVKKPPPPPPPICGNNKLDAKETCDPPSSCPTDCDDGVACTVDTLTGSAANCNATCSNQAINQCSDGDGCCPQGCVYADDEDCPPSLPPDAGSPDVGLDAGSLDIGLPPDVGLAPDVGHAPDAGTETSPRPVHSNGHALDGGCGIAGNPGLDYGLLGLLVILWRRRRVIGIG